MFLSELLEMARRAEDLSFVSAKAMARLLDVAILTGDKESSPFFLGNIFVVVSAKLELLPEIKSAF